MNSKILRFFVALTMVVMGACSKKHKPDEVTSDLAIPDSVIEKQDMTFSPDGSDNGQIVGLYSIHFDYDRSQLTAESRDLIRKDAQWLKAHPQMTFQIEGHCDRHGSIEYNFGLGDRRAQAVREYLVNLGISKDRLSTISYGKEKLLDLGESEIADAANRRANFKVVHGPVENPQKM